MTTRTIIDIINADNDNTILQGAIRAAYWYGQSVAAVRLGNKYATALSAARAEAKKLRYHHQAMGLLRTIDGGQGYIYDASYSDTEIGTWDFSI